MNIMNILIAGMLLLASSCALPADDGLTMGASSAAENASLLGLASTASVAGPEVEHSGDHDRGDDWVCVARYRSCYGDDHHDFAGTGDGSTRADLALVTGDAPGPANRDDDDYDDDDRDHDDDRCDRDCRSRFYIGTGDRRREARHEAIDRCEDRHHHDRWRCELVACKHIH